MNMDSNPSPVGTQAGQTRRAARFPLHVLPWVLAIGLAITNIGTLLSEPAQSAGHAILVPAIKAVLDNTTWGPSKRGERAGVVETAEELARKNRMLAEREKKLESTVAELRRENSVAKAQKVESDRRLVKLEGEYTGLQSKYVALEKDRNALKELSVRRAKAVKTVADRISKKLAVHAGELIGELPLRAVPYVGVVALVAGTALDVSSDCDLARTLNGLVLEHQEAALDTHAVCQYIDKIPSPSQIWNATKSKPGVPAVPAVPALPAVPTIDRVTPLR